MSDEGFYYLMHKNDIAAVLTIDEISGNIIKVGKRVEKSLLPPGGSLSAENLKKWWIRRAVPISQGKIKKILLSCGVPTVQKYLSHNLGLSLSDHYWINPVSHPLSWEKVNLFQNDFKDEIGELQFLREENVQIDILDLHNKTIFYPSASAQGELQKKWIVQDGIRCLIKGNYGVSCQQSINEVIATMIHERQKQVPYTVYRLCEIDTEVGIGRGCICRDFATEKVEFISAYDIVSSVKKRNEVSEYEHFIAVCAANGLPEEQVRAFLEYQILSDFVITNTDRHFNNFGVLRDSDTLRFLGMAPIFDSGNSLFWNRLKLPFKSDLLDISVSSFCKKEKDLLRYVKDVSRLDIQKLPSEEEIRKLLEYDNDYENRKASVLEGYRKKRELLWELQGGKKISSCAVG